MNYIIKIDDEEQLNFLKRVVENLYIKMHSNTSGYVEYLDIIDALKINFDNASIEKDQIIEIISNPITKKEIISKLEKPERIKKPAKKVLSQITKLPSFCEDHQKYTAQRSPRTDCQACWSAYKRLNPAQYAVAHRKFLRTHKAVSE